MNNLPIEFADWQTPCTPQADKAPAAVGPLVGAGLGGAPRFNLTFTRTDGTDGQMTVHGFDGLQGGIYAAFQRSEFVLVEVVR